MAQLPRRDLAVRLYRRMLLVRGFEDRVQSLFLRGEIYGTTHLYSGQEAVAVGFLHSYANSTHENAARDAVAARDPSMPVFLSSEVERKKSIPISRHKEAGSNENRVSSDGADQLRELSNVAFAERALDDAGEALAPRRP